MTHSDRDRLIEFLDALETQADKRQEFVADPLQTMITHFGVDDMIDDTELPLATRLTIDLLRNPHATSRIDDLCKLRAATTISDEVARTQIASCLVEAASPAVRADLLQKWTVPGVDPMSPQAIANLVVAVDVAAVATKFVVHHEDYVISGGLQKHNNEVYRLAQLIAAP